MVDRSAFVLAAYETHRREILAFTLRLARDPDVARDLADEVFARLTAEVHRGQAPLNVRAWAFRVAANLAASRGRHLSAGARWGALVHLDTVADGPDRVAERRERHARLEVALAGLLPDARVALVLAARGYSGREIAGALGRSEGATRTLLCRARLRLRAELTEFALER